MRGAEGMAAGASSNSRRWLSGRHDSVALLKFAITLVALVPAPAPCAAEPRQYPVGGAWDSAWAPAAPGFYQDWADKLKLFVNDSLLFTYDPSLYDMTGLWNEADLSSCSVQNKALYTNGARVFDFAVPGTYYITSSGSIKNTVSANCQAGMEFKVLVHDPNEQVPAPAPESGTSTGTPVQLPSKRGVDIRFGITWEPQADPAFYTNFLTASLLSNGLTFLPDTAVLVFSYIRKEHNVLQVTKADFDSCRVPDFPIAIFANPDAAVPLSGNGTYYFIDGVGNSCAAGNMKMTVRVGLPLESETTTFPWEAVIIPCFCATALMTFLWGLRVWYRRQHGSKPRGKYQERHVVTSGVFEATGKFGGKSARQQSAIISGMLAGTGGRILFSFRELQRATHQFSADNQVGSGAFGTVYQGTLDDGTMVAIKRTKHAGASDMDQFVNEVAILSQVNNRHLVKLLGCCVDLEVPLLVYEFIPNGTLQDHLNVAQFSGKLDWPARFKIALQTAEALKYLHVQATPPIFHRDVKSANILLDDEFNAKVADFGLSKLVDLEATHVSTVVKGTPGYLDPEYFHNFQLTDKTDVYSYGVVLLELITSKKPIDVTLVDADQNLALRSVPLIKSGRTREIMDAGMLATLSEKELQRVEAVAQVAVACLVSSRAARPSMSEVVEMLQRIKGSDLKAEEFYIRDEASQRAAYRAIEMRALADLSEDSHISESQLTTSQTSTPTSSNASYDSNTPMNPR